MSAMSDRVKANIERLGETLSFTKLAGTAGSFSVECIVQPLDSGTMRTFLDDVETMGVTHPALKGTVAGDSTVAVNDTFTREGVTYTVLKVFFHRVGSDVIGKTLVCSV